MSQWSVVLPQWSVVLSWWTDVLSWWSVVLSLWFVALSWWSVVLFQWSVVLPKWLGVLPLTFVPSYFPNSNSTSISNPNPNSNPITNPNPNPLGNFLTRSKLPNLTTHMQMTLNQCQQEPRENSGFKPCGSQRCYACKFHCNEATTFESTAGNYSRSIFDARSCDSVNIIYLITCRISRGYCNNTPDTNFVKNDFFAENGSVAHYASCYKAPSPRSKPNMVYINFTNVTNNDTEFSRFF